MESLTNLTLKDVQLGVLHKMLANIGISNVKEYVEQFHRQTEELVVEDFQQFGSNQIQNDEQTVPPADVQTWLTAIRPRLEDSENVPESKQELKESPMDLASWMQKIAPVDMPIPKQADNFDLHNREDVGTWLNDWSTSLAQQPPPTSLDTWLQGLVPSNMHESLAKQNNAKTRLNSYLNAAQKVLSQHGYDVSNPTKATSSAPTKTGFLGNVRQMYFLWKTLDKNNDRKITVEDVEILLQEMGVGFLSKSLASSLFNIVDTNHDGTLQFRDFVAMMSIIKQLLRAVRSAKA